MYQTCIREDAQRRIDGLTPIPRDVITLITADPNYWIILQQVIKTCKPIVDAIGNLESRNATLADCMVELIRCARGMSQLVLEDGEDAGLLEHAKQVFNTEFHRMDTELHGLALFLHPLCRKLAIGHLAKGRSFETICKIALEVARKWRWGKDMASRLLDDLQQYYRAQGPFIGGKANARDWWESINIDTSQHPIKLLAIKLALIVPHAAEVERLFSDLGGIQGLRRSRLTVSRFEALGKLRANYKRHTYQYSEAKGKSVHRKHAHMHAREESGIDVPLASDLETTFTWAPPITSATNFDSLDALEGRALEELEAAFADLDLLPSDNVVDPILMSSAEITAAAIYDFSKLEDIDKGLIPAADVVDLTFAREDVPEAWTAQSLLRAKGISDS